MPAPPLVSVIIPCYNQAQYLSKAIESVRRQTYSAVEIIVVDDGSEDDTKSVVGKYPNVQYIYQQNAGLSAARNTGVRHCSGEFVLFLDSDDWLYPRGIEYNVTYMQQHPTYAFVYGAYYEVFTNDGRIHENIPAEKPDTFNQLLNSNCIGMIATVLFRTSLFSEFSYDTKLKNCEDYDLYLAIARKYPFGHHSNIVAAYRLHSSNMSADLPAMLEGILLVLERHVPTLKNAQEREDYQKGRNTLTSYYTKLLYSRMRRKEAKVNKHSLKALFKHRPYLYFKFILAEVVKNIPAKK